MFREIIKLYVLQQIAAIRYNRVVDPLWDFRASISSEALERLVNTIPYNGVGTLTGQALNYVTTNLLRPGTGNRPEVDDLVIVLTDGRAQDNAEAPAIVWKDFIDFMLWNHFALFSQFYELSFNW